MYLFYFSGEEFHPHFLPSLAAGAARGAASAYAAMQRARGGWLPPPLVDMIPHGLYIGLTEPRMDQSLRGLTPRRSRGA